MCKEKKCMGAEGEVVYTSDLRKRTRTPEHTSEAGKQLKKAPIDCYLSKPSVLHVARFDHSLQKHPCPLRSYVCCGTVTVTA
jgi:hypothetical protein